MALSHIPDLQTQLAASAHWSAHLNADQGLLGRCYLVLQRPETDALAVTDAELTELWAFARHIRTALTALFAPDHFNYALLMNQDAQVHFHLIPRYHDRRQFSGGTFVDPDFGGHYTVSAPRTLDPAAFQALLAALRKQLSPA